METRVALLEQRSDNIEKMLEGLIPRIQEHEVACEINIPKAESAQKAVAHLSKAISDINIKITDIIREAERVDEERKQRDIRDAVFKDSSSDAINSIRNTTNETNQSLSNLIGEINGKKEGRTLIVGFIITILLGYSGWLGLTTYQNSIDISYNKAIKNEKTSKTKKKSDNNGK